MKYYMWEVPFIARFSIGPKEECWPWLGATNEGGYGTLSTDGTTRTASSLSYEYFNDVDPAGFDVCHTCDNRICVNHYHLFLGTRKDNMEDMKAKGRQAHGSKNARAILAESDIRMIRTSGLCSKDLCCIFNVSRGHMNDIIAGKKWSHLC